MIDTDETRRRPPRALIVDDDSAAVKFIADRCAKMGVAIETAPNALQALVKARQSPPDVLIVDMRMPDLDGRALYEEVERRWPAQAERIVFVTGDTLTAGLRDFVSESGRPVIEKPFLPVEVRRIVAELAIDRDVMPRK